VTTGSGEDAPTTRYAHNALGQRVFKTEPLYAPVQGEDAGFFGAFTNFISQMWNPATQAEMLGYAYVYDEAGSLIGEYGMGGANSAGSAKYVYLPTASGPMLVMAFVGGRKYAVHADHLNTPRRLTQPMASRRGSGATAPSGKCLRPRPSGASPTRRPIPPPAAQQRTVRRPPSHHLTLHRYAMLQKSASISDSATSAARRPCDFMRHSPIAESASRRPCT